MFQTVTTAASATASVIREVPNQIKWSYTMKTLTNPIAEAVAQGGTEAATGAAQGGSAFFRVGAPRLLTTVGRIGLQAYALGLAIDLAFDGIGFVARRAMNEPVQYVRPTAYPKVVYRYTKRSFVRSTGALSLVLTVPITVGALACYAGYTLLVGVPVYCVARVLTGRDGADAAWDRVMKPAATSFNFVVRNSLGRSFQLINYSFKMRVITDDIRLQPKPRVFDPRKGEYVKAFDSNSVPQRTTRVAVKNEQVIVDPRTKGGVNGQVKTAPAPVETVIVTEPVQAAESAVTVDIDVTFDVEAIKAAPKSAGWDFHNSLAVQDAAAAVDFRKHLNSALAGLDISTADRVQFVVGYDAAAESFAAGAETSH